MRHVPVTGVDDDPAMGDLLGPDLTGRRVALLSYRLGGADGVSVTAAQWVLALRRLGTTVRTVAGGGRPDVLVRGLGLEPGPPPTRRALDAALGDADVVVVDNLCSLPVNPAAGVAVASYLRGRAAVLRHHDLPWERERFASFTDWPPDDPAWRHVTINEPARLALAARGITATTLHHGFAETPRPQARSPLRRMLGVGDRPLVLQPTRAVGRKNIAAGLALAEAVDGVFWLTGPAEEGYAVELAALLAGARCPVRRRLPPGVDMAAAYAACDIVVLPSTWEGFGLPLVESALHRRPIAVGAFPVAEEIRAYGFRWFTPADGPALRGFVAAPDTALLDHNEAVARAHFGIDSLAERLRGVLAGLPVRGRPVLTA